MCGNPFESVGKAIGSVFKGAGSFAGSLLGMDQNMPTMKVPKPLITPPPPSPPEQSAAPPTSEYYRSDPSEIRRRGRASLRITRTGGNVGAGGSGVNVPRG